MCESLTNYVSSAARSHQPGRGQHHEHLDHRLAVQLLDDQRGQRLRFQLDGSAAIGPIVDLPAASEALVRVVHLVGVGIVVQAFVSLVVFVARVQREA